MVSGENWVFTGIPRAGTSVSTRLLGSLPNTVALNEPLQLKDFQYYSDPAMALQFIRQRYQAIRKQVEVRGTAPAVNLAGAQGDARVQAADGTGLRQPQGAVSDVEVSAQPGFRLVIKQNALFTALLHGLTDDFECLALVRNPLEVLASWQTVDLAINRGSLPGGERYDGQLAGALEGEPDRLARQLLILDWFYRRFRACLPDARILRFEEVARCGAVPLAKAVGDKAAEAEPLAQTPLVERYPGVDLQSLMAALLTGPEGWRMFYTTADCEQALG